jgi:PII-like signaling protein
MKVEAEQVLCRFHLSTRVRHHGEPLYQWIVETARHDGLQGATVLKGIMGLRPNGTVLAEHRWTVSQDLPVIVEVVDGPRRIEALLGRVEPVFTEGEITLERAHVVLYRDSGDRGRPAGDGIDVIQSRGDSAAWKVTTMKLPEEGVLLRIFMGESDRDPGSDRPLYEAIVHHAREAGLAGATVLRGPLGFGKHSIMHSAKLLEMSTDLPIVIEIVDAEDRIQAFLPVVDQFVTEGMVTLEAVRIVKYAAAPSDRRTG